MAFTIKELELLSGIKSHTIRIWEQRYQFLKPSRTQTNIRSYSNDELKTLLTVALLNRHGYKVSKIDEMHPQLRIATALTLPQQEAHAQNLVNEMIGHMIDLNCMAFEELVNNYTRKYGIERTITELIFNFLEKVGILWQTNCIMPLQEHIVSNMIRQKIISAIEALPLVKETTPLFTLFLPEDEHHEMGLLFVYYLLRKKGIPVIYLGANVPLKDVGYLLQLKKPAYLYLHLTSFPHQHNFQKFLTTLAEKAAASHILISGSGSQFFKKPPAPNITLLQSFAGVISYISSIQE